MPVAPWQPEKSEPNTGLATTVCAECGNTASVEEVTITRPGRGNVSQLITRCLRKAPKARRCGVIVEEKPLADETDDPTILPEEIKLCECGCGNPIDSAKRFYSRQCLARHAQKFKAGRVASAPPELNPSVHEEPDQEDPMTEDKPEENPAPRRNAARRETSIERAPAKQTAQDDLEQVFEALRYLRGLPRDVRKKAIELLESVEDSMEA